MINARTTYTDAESTHASEARQLENAQDRADRSDWHVSAGSRQPLACADVFDERVETDWPPTRRKDVQDARRDFRTGEEIDQRIFEPS